MKAVQLLFDLIGIYKNRPEGAVMRLNYSK